MDVPLYEGKSLGFDRILVNFSLKFKSLPPYPFSAIVDTGCPFTFISEDSLKGKRIPYSELKTIDKSPVSLGFVKLDIRELGNYKIFFRDINNQLIEFEHPIYVGVPLIKGHLLGKIPCFIGKDFIDKHKLSIITKEGKRFLCKE